MHFSYTCDRVVSQTRGVPCIGFAGRRLSVSTRIEAALGTLSSNDAPRERLTNDMNAAIGLDSGILDNSAATAGTRKGMILRYKADRRSVSIALGLFAVHALIFFFAPTWVAALCLIPLTAASMFVAAINHHHQHFNTFRSAWLNRIYELALSLQTGISPYGWVLHHNLGHHRNYLNQRPHAQPDESKWTRKDGSQMGRVEYTIDLVLHHQIDIFRIGMKYRRYLRAYLLMKIPLWAIVGLAIYVNPANALLVIIIPAFLTLCHTSWATYEHHAGCYPTNHYDASVNRTNALYNYLTCNLGYHTAHHKRPGVHWSLLPKIHDEIKDEIPPEMILPAFW
jgi:fatty acid desaturase